MNVTAQRGGEARVGRLQRLLRRCAVYYTAAMLAFLSVVLVFFLEPLSLTVEEVPVGMRGWGAASGEARVVLLADVHAAVHDGARLERIVAESLAQKPEAVVLLGDYFSALKPGKAMSAERVAAYLAPLGKAATVYYVCGNHDNGAAGRELRRRFRELGFVNLENAEQVHTFANGQELMLRGDYCSPEPVAAAAGKPSRRVGRRFAAEKLPADMPLLAVAHNPYPFLHTPIYADLAVGGHTHGGQVCVPGGRPVAMHAPWTPESARAGMHRGVGGCAVYISRGLGLSRLPIRFCCPPEITVLVMKPE